MAGVENQHTRKITHTVDRLHGEYARTRAHKRAHYTAAAAVGRRAAISDRYPRVRTTKNGGAAAVRRRETWSASSCCRSESDATRGISGGGTTATTATTTRAQRPRARLPRPFLRLFGFFPVFFLFFSSLYSLFSFFYFSSIGRVALRDHRVLVLYYQAARRSLPRRRGRATRRRPRRCRATPLAGRPARPGRSTRQARGVARCPPPSSETRGRTMTTTTTPPRHRRRSVP